MKRLNLIVISFSSLVTFGGCNNSQSTILGASSDLTTSEITSLSSQNTSTELSPEEQKRANISNFKDHILSCEGSVKQRDVINVTSTSYASETVPLVMLTGYQATAIRYTDIVEINGRYSFLNESGVETDGSDYKTQIFYDSRNFYKVTQYKETSYQSGNKAESTPFNEENIKSFLSIGYPIDEYNSALYLLEYLDRKDVKVEENNMAGYVYNGSWSYSYNITFYESDETGSVISQYISVSSKLTLVNGIITNAEQTMNNDLYAGGVKLNYQESYTQITYTQGTFEEFKGTLLNH